MREDLDNLINALLPFAMELLAKRNEFYPFGAVISEHGGVERCAAYTGSEYPSSSEVTDALIAGFRSRAKTETIRATGVCHNGTISAPEIGKRDAILLDLESAAECCRLALPYAKRILRGYRYGSIIRLALEPSVFPHAKPSA